MNHLLKGRSKTVLSISSWFCLPEQGMKDFEILSRASAFLVKSPKNNGLEFKNENGNVVKKNIHVLTASHVASPWKWSKYYPDEWLQHVNEKHTHYSVELRHADGVFATQSFLLPRSYHHSNRDLASLYLENEDEVLKLLAQFGHHPMELSDDSELEIGMPLEFHGHEVTGEIDKDGVDIRKPYPRISRGIMQGRTFAQSFSKTSPILTDGMCGGPVIMQSNRSQNIDGLDGLKICGLIEGIIPIDHDIEELRGLACFVEGNTISKFIDDIENGLIDPLIGGESIDTVSNDKDPEKMDFEKICKKYEEE